MLKDLVRISRSYRSFDRTVPITAEQLTDWIDCARLCPSSINLQMLKFHPVTDAAECQAVLEQTRWAGKLKDIKLPPVGHEPTAYIIVCADQTVTPRAEIFLKDVGICAQTIMLAAAEAGFGGCMIGNFSAEEMQKTLRFPKTLIPQLVLALGKPDEEVRLCSPSPDGSVTYYRENGIHYVQKRTLEDLIV